MSDEGAPQSPEALRALKARLLAQAEAAIDRDMAEAQRLAATYPNLFKITPNENAFETSPKSEIRQKVESQPPAGGSIATLAQLYLTDERSPFHKLQHAVRANYENTIKRIVKDCGHERIADLKDENIRAVYDKWKEGGKLSVAHSRATKLRHLVHFGDSVLKDPACERLSVVMHNMRFKVAVHTPNQPMSEKHAKTIISKAHAIGLRSIALAQAFQFDCKLAQKDVIGEWVPISDQSARSLSAEIYDNTKWLHGIRWSEIDSDMILRHKVARTQKEIELDLKLSSLVMGELREEIRRRESLPSSGPVIVFEKTGRPYTGHQFRTKWRLVANIAGIPKRVKNMNSSADAADEDEPDAQRERESAR
jgi:hypothetical protein